MGERFSHYIQSLEIIGDIDQYTEAFCHYVNVKFSRSNKIKFVKFHTVGKKNQENVED